MDIILRILKNPIAVASMIITVGSRILDGISFVQLGLPYWAWTTLGLAIFMLVTLSIAYGAQKAATVLQGQNGGATLVATDSSVSGIEFHESRPSQKWFRDTFEEAKEIWGLWNTGGTALNYHHLRSPSVRQVLLPHPEGSMIPLLAATMGETPSHIAGRIRAVTEELLNEKRRVKWWNGLACNLMTLGDPLAQNAWVLVEPTFPNLSSDNRFSIRIFRQEQPLMFEKLLKVYQHMWDAAANVEPSQDDVWRVPSHSRASLTVDKVIDGQLRSKQYDTKNRKDELIDVGVLPFKLHFKEPEERTVIEDDLPVRFSYPNGWFDVKWFTSKGYVVDETGETIGIHVEVFTKRSS